MEAFLSIWFVLWLLLSLVLIYFFGWTLFILLKQKKAWKAYAVKNNLRYSTKKVLSSPEISGALGDYTVNLFTGEHMAEDARSSRKLTAVEIQLSSTLPVEAGIANGEMISFIQKFCFKEEMRPKYKDWDNSYIASSDDKVILEKYLTKERFEALMSLMKVKNAWTLLAFRKDISLLRFDTPDPLLSVKKIDSLVNQMLKTAAILELKDGEAEHLKSKQSNKQQKEGTLDIDENEIDAGDLSLEEDNIKS